MNAGDWVKSKLEIQEPCEYCGDEKKLIDFDEYDWQFGASPEMRIIGNRLNAKYEAYSADSSFEREYEINYCPMCRRKLSES